MGVAVGVAQIASLYNYIVLRHLKRKRISSTATTVMILSRLTEGEGHRRFQSRLI